MPSALATEDVPAAENESAGSDAPAADPRDSGSMDSVLGRLVKAGLWRDQEETAAAESAAPAESAPAEPEPAPVSDYQPPRSFLPPADFVDDADEMEAPPAIPPSHSPAPLAPPAATGPGDEESIESYMERLMQRVRGDGSKPSAAASQPASHFAPEPSVPASVAESKTPPPPTDARPPQEFLPRSQAPEASANLAAMRELANSAARSAIATHQQKHTSKRATGKLIGSLVVLALSLGLVFVAWQASSLAAAIGAGVGIAVSCWGMSAGLWRLLQSMQLKRPGEKGAAVEAGSGSVLNSQPAAPAADDAVELQPAAAQPIAEQPAGESA
jgi:hypothetical protein